MSTTETHTGTITKVKGNLEELCQDIVDYNYDLEVQTKYNQTAVDFVRENYEDYIIIRDSLYKVSDKSIEEDMSVSWLQEDSIGYLVSFYNGGCGFLEALEEAVEDKLDKN